MTYNFVDYTIILLVLLSAFKGYRAGLVGSIVRFFGSLLALVASIKFYRPTVNLLESHFKIVSLLSDFLGEQLPISFEVGRLPVSGNSIYLLKASLEQMALPKIIKEQIISKLYELVSLAGKLGIATTGELITYLLAQMLINGAVLILLWLLMQKTLLLLSHLLSKGLGSSLLGSVNHFLGFFTGACLSILGLTITFAFLNLFLEFTRDMHWSFLSHLDKHIAQSQLVPYLWQGYELILAKIITFI